MALDGIFLNSLINNLKDVLIDSKIDKINQPEKDEVILTIRKDRKNYKLLISASSKFPRIHFTETSKENPLKAPMYLMVLRKYLTSGRIVDVYQKDGDRIVIIKVESRDELGFDSEYSLIVEIMGRHSNITLVRNRDNKIMESIKHITPDINSYRVLYPGATYVEPPKSTKLNPFSLDINEMTNFIKENNLEYNDLFFSKLLTGVSKPLSKELYENSLKENISTSNISSLYKYTTSSINDICNHPSFNIITDSDGIYKDFYCAFISNHYICRNCTS